MSKFIKIGLFYMQMDNIASIAFSSDGNLTTIMLKEEVDHSWFSDMVRLRSPKYNLVIVKGPKYIQLAGWLSQCMRECARRGFQSNIHSVVVDPEELSDVVCDGAFKHIWRDFDEFGNRRPEPLSK